MDKHLNKFIVFVVVACFLGATGTAAAETKLAQSDSVKEAVEDVKESVDTLVAAKDENVSDDLALRVEAFKKVVDLSITEARELKVNILLIEEEEDLIMLWKEAVLESLNNALDYFEGQKGEVLDEIEDSEVIKDVARGFKEWREENYLPVADQISSFLVLKKGEKIINIVTTREQKIAEDVSKLEEANIEGVSILQDSLREAGGLIGEGAEVVKAARMLFIESYAEPTFVVAGTSTDPLIIPEEGGQSSSTNALSGEEGARQARLPLRGTSGQASSTELRVEEDEDGEGVGEDDAIGLTDEGAEEQNAGEGMPKEQNTEEVIQGEELVAQGELQKTVDLETEDETGDQSSTSTKVGEVIISEDGVSTSTDSGTESVSIDESVLEEEARLGTSIKDLVKTSFGNIKEAYQVFIEMSNFVRKLL